MTDVAREAHVSLATVDRALNGRGGVRAQTRAQITAAAHRLGYPVADVDGSITPPAPVRLVFLLPDGTNAFINDLAQQVAAQSDPAKGIRASVELVAEFNPTALAARLVALKGTVDGIALVALDHPQVREAIRELLAAGTHLVTLASDILNVPHQGYVGIDNAQAGRLAGYLLGRFLGPGATGKVAFFAGSLFYRGHLEREMGFRQVLTEDFPALELVELREVQEDRTRAEAEMTQLLARHPDLAGIYNAGGATAGIAAALRRGPRNPVFIAHEVTTATKALLLDNTLDAVIDQNPGAEVAEALRLLTGAARRQTVAAMPPQMRVFFRENLPEA